MVLETLQGIGLLVGGGHPKSGSGGFFYCHEVAELLLFLAHIARNLHLKITFFISLGFYGRSFVIELVLSFVLGFAGGD